MASQRRKHTAHTATMRTHIVHRLLLIPPTLSLLFLAAHELRTGDLLQLSGWTGLALLMLTVRRAWARHVSLLALCLGLAVWNQVTVELLRFRIFEQQPYTLLPTIMGSVVLLMLASVLILLGRRMRVLFEGNESQWND